MALLGMESFDIYGTADIDDYFTNHGLGSIAGGAGRCGSAAWLGTAAIGSGPDIGVNATTRGGFCGFAMNPNGFSSVACWTINDDAFPCAFLRSNPDGSLSFWKGPNTTLGTEMIRTAANFVHVGLYTHIGLEWMITSSGYCRIYVNGNLAKDSGTVNMIGNGIFDGQWRTIGFVPSGYVDDCYWGDTNTGDPLNPYGSFLGDTHIEGQNCLTDAAGGGGTYRDFTLSGGTDHGILLKSNPIDITKYVTSSTVGNKETVKYANIIPTTGVVYAIQTMPNAVKNTFSDRHIANIVYNGSTLSLGTDQTLAQTNQRYYPQMYAKNPATSTAWTIATTNASQNGIQITV